ncbi:DUF3471 domain-containing protein [Flavobacteriaceae bacterium AU392]|nr:serine hydrolase [Flavobacteriaceae bacterium]RKM81117.1 DUF3471 domain-containing protein [Flavobacteriaceae bacterium AU392]
MKSLLPIISFLFVCYFGHSQNLETQINNYINSVYKPNESGATVLVGKGGKTIYRKAFGLSNLELETKMKPENVFEIGSITKQFTAIAILMLEEQGKLKVTDNITKYISDYPTQGATITIHNLLNHTSGIKDYTSMENFIKLVRTDMSPTELIDVFKNEPMDFRPGERFLYSNSGYVLLGHIIEIVSGQSYEGFIEKYIFDKIEMSSSTYGKTKQIIKNRASGYQQNGNDYVNSEYLSLTLAYAAGALMSNIDDLYKWQKALNTNQLITRKSYEKAINGSTLNNGEHITYGYGLDTNNIQGSKSISHNGSTLGYATMGIYMPEEDVFVSVLTNCDCKSPDAIANKIAALVIGKPFPNKEDAIVLNENQLKKWVGAYEFEGSIIRHITLKGKQLFSQKEGSTNVEIYPMTASNFIFDGGTTVYDFYTENEKRMVKMTSNGISAMGKGIDKASPSEKKEISLPLDVLKQYVGKYELAPDFIIEVTIDGTQIFAQATGQGRFELFAEDKTNFFVKVVAAKVRFNKDASSKVESLTLFQGGQEMLAKKIDKAVPSERKEISLPLDVLKQYVGKYELAPDFIIEITIDDTQIFAQATGQGQFELFAEDKANFFVKVVAAKVRFNKDASNKVESLTLFQDGQEMLAKKIE